MGSGLHEGTVTTGLVDKLGEVATTIDNNRNQDQLDHGTYDTNEKNRAFREFQLNHPKELIADVYYRSVPSYLYEPAGGAREGSSVIWDEELFILLRNPKLFEARYVYDRKAHDRLHDDLRAIYDGLMAWP